MGTVKQSSQEIVWSIEGQGGLCAWPVQSNNCQIIFDFWQRYQQVLTWIRKTSKNKVYTPAPRNQIKWAHCTIFYQNCPFPTIDSIYLKSMWNFPGCHRPCRLEFQAVVRIKDFLLQKVNSLKKPKSGPPSSQASVSPWQVFLGYLDTQLYVAQNVSSRYMLIVYNYACTYNYYIYIYIVHICS